MKTSGLLLLLSALWGGAVAQSKNLPEPAFKTSPPVVDKVVAEDQYGFKIRQYTPAVEVKPITRDMASYENPEAAVIAAISAMVSKDFDWYRTTWDRASIARMDERDKALNQSAQFWTSTWERAFKDKRTELTARIETGEYVLIVYRLVSATGISGAVNTPAGDIELVTVLKFQEGKWLATQELFQDPVLLYWKTPEIRPKRIVRTVQ